MMRRAPRLAVVVGCVALAAISVTAKTVDSHTSPGSDLRITADTASTETTSLGTSQPGHVPLGTSTVLPGVQLTDDSAATAPNRLTLGTTLAQYAYDPWNDPTAVQSGKAVLASAVRYQAQHLMGFGALNPSPAPGVRDWTSLDSRMAGIRDSGEEPVLILCCSPDWMKGGAAGVTDWTKIETAPLPAHFKDFAALAAEAALRYPFVKYFVVWNELKGFFDSATNNWRTDEYIDLWKQTAAAIRAVRPDALIGGPYVPIDSYSADSSPSNPSVLSGAWGVTDQRVLDVLAKFLTSTDPDFIAVDAKSTPKNVDDFTGDPFDATGKFAAIDDWLRQRTSKPIWWMEYYPQPPNARWSGEQQAAIEAATLMRMAYSGASAAFLWSPVQDLSGRPSLTTGVGSSAGGIATPTGLLFATLQKVLQPDLPIRRLVSNTPAVEGWGVGANLIIISRSPLSSTVELPDGRQMLVAPWTVTVLPG